MIGRQAGVPLFLEGDVTEILSGLDDGTFDAVFSDPPYGLKFMGKSWDHGVPSTKVWGEVLRVLKPGGFLLAFGGTRTYHRLACAIEDAGFEVRDCLMWLYGQGFPKSLDISKAIDKAAERVDLGPSPNWREAKRDNGPSMNPVPNEARLTAPATEDAIRWNGYGTALKPAWEPITLAMKPLAGTFVENALEYGVAGLNVDGCRIGTQGATKRSEQADYPANEDGTEDRSRSWARTGHSAIPVDAGRWPSNVVLSHTEFCREVGTREVKTGTAVGGLGRSGSSVNAYGRRRNLPPGEDQTYGEGGRETVPAYDCHPLCPVRALDEQSGDLGRSSVTEVEGEAHTHGIYGSRTKEGRGQIGKGDYGGASRFFYTAKVSNRERDMGLPKGTNKHPTLKPVKLCEYLSRLLLPPTRESDTRKLLVPFSGSGSEVIGGLLAGWEEVTGVEIDPEYIEIAEGRTAYAVSQIEEHGGLTK